MPQIAVSILSPQKAVYSKVLEQFKFSVVLIQRDRTVEYAIEAIKVCLEDMGTKLNLIRSLRS